VLAPVVKEKFLAIDASSARDIDAASKAFTLRRIDAFLVAPDAFFTEQREQLTALAARYTFPAVYFDREFVVAGGLMSYGTPLRDSYHQAGIYAGRILSGAKPADLPVVQATRFELVINLKTARTLGLDVPANLLALADEVIE
jgi:putative ABC transport system substrate-binding protein